MKVHGNWKQRLNIGAIAIRRAANATDLSDGLAPRRQRAWSAEPTLRRRAPSTLPTTHPNAARYSPFPISTISTVCHPCDIPHTIVLPKHLRRPVDAWALAEARAMRLLLLQCASH